MKKPISFRLLYLNFGHFTNHMLMLIFAKAAFSAGIDFGFGKDGAFTEMISYGIPSLVLFGACAPLAAHLADHWNRNGMLIVFFYWHRIVFYSDRIRPESSPDWFWTGFHWRVCINLPSCRYSYGNRGWRKNRLASRNEWTVG